LRQNEPAQLQNPNNGTWRKDPEPKEIVGGVLRANARDYWQHRYKPSSVRSGYYGL